MSISAINNGLKTISSEIGILYQLTKLPRLNLDPSMISYGIWPANTTYLSGESFGGRSSGCGFDWEDAILGTIGETLERYASAFYNLDESISASYKNLGKHAIHPSQFALFHHEQYQHIASHHIHEFTEDTCLTWFPTIDLTNGKETYLPGQFIYLPFNQDEKLITIGTSTGLAAHTNYYKAILSGLYESIERDSFVLTWMHQLVPPKIKINQEVRHYIDSHFPAKYNWHFFNMTYDISVPSILGFCFGEADFGKFVAIGASTRATYGQALQKTIQEIGQAIPYFRYLLGEKKDWAPNDDYSLIQNFEDHSIFYTKRPDLWSIFDRWIEAQETKEINLFEQNKHNDQDEIKHIVQLMKDKGYSVLFKDITTPDIRQLGFFSIKIFIPQLIPLSGVYPLYFLGGERLYTVPKKMGYKTYDYPHLNKYPHPFP